jgi:hypothetical protein
MSERHCITEEGIQEALDVLDRGGFLPDATEDEALDTLTLKTACEKYISASREKGDKRTEQDVRDALIVGYFEAHISDRVRRMIN